VKSATAARACGLLLWLASACSEDDPCAGKSVELPCDIRAAACRCSVFEATKQMRAQPDAELPPARVITRETFAAETRATMRGAMQAEGTRVYQEALKLLSLLPATSSLDGAQADAEIAGVAAYYDPDERAVTIIADAADSELEGVFTLSHEYVHALQDQRESFEALYKEEVVTDGFMAVKALTEGEAVLLSDLVLLAIRERPFDARGLALFDEILASTLAAIRESPAPLTEAQLGMPYPVGAAALGEAYLGGGLARVSALYPGRPRTFTGWFAPEAAASLPGALGCQTPEPPSGYKAWGVDRLGGSALPALGGRLGYDNASMLELAESWRNDAFALYSTISPATRPLGVVVAWRIGFASESVASKLEASLRAAGSTLEITRTNDELLLIGASDPSVLAAWSARSVCNLPKGRDEEQRTRLVPELTRHIHDHGTPASRALRGPT